jgi:hypothetical protein
VGDKDVAPAAALPAQGPVYDGDMYVYENSDAFPKGICVDKEIFAAGGRLPTEHGKLGITGVLDELGSNICGRCVIETYSEERIELSAHADKNCFLLFQDTYYPGWKAYVNGKPARILATDLGFRAIELDAGEHGLKMEYKPWSIRVGLGLTAIGLILGFLYARKSKSWQEE